jgi:hypothetical protein
MKIRFASIALLIALLASGVARAQSIDLVRPLTATATLTTGTCSGTSISATGCIGLNLAGYQHVAVQITGTWTGTITFEISLDGGTTWVTQNMLPSTGTQTAVTTTTANGVWYSTQLVASQFRARFSTATTPPVVVWVRASM